MRSLFCQDHATPAQLDTSRNEPSDRSSETDEEEEDEDVVTAREARDAIMRNAAEFGTAMELDEMNMDDDFMLNVERVEDLADGDPHSADLVNSLRSLFDPASAIGRAGVRLFSEYPKHLQPLLVAVGGPGAGFGQASVTPGAQPMEMASTVNFTHPLLQQPTDLMLSPLTMITPSNGDEAGDLGDGGDHVATLQRWRRHAGLDFRRNFDRMQIVLAVPPVADRPWRHSGLHRQNAIRDVRVRGRRPTFFGSAANTSQLTPTEHSLITR